MTKEPHGDTQRIGPLPGGATHAFEVHVAQKDADRIIAPTEARAGSPVVAPASGCLVCASKRIAQVLAHCSDMCGVQVAGRRHHGYVPRDLGIGGGDDVQLAYCLDCGRIRGEFPLPRTAIEDGRSAD